MTIDLSSNAAQDRYRQLLDTAPDAMIVVGPDGTVVGKSYAELLDVWMATLVFASDGGGGEPGEERLPLVDEPRAPHAARS